MATGITKREQHSEDAISVLDFYREPIPLPPSDAEVILSYPNKADRSEIIIPTPRRFLMMEGGSTAEIDTIPKTPSSSMTTSSFSMN